MAVAAIDPVIEDVMEMAELHGLLDVLVGASDVGGAPDQHGDQYETRHEHEGTGETELGNRIRAAMEDLGHRRLIGVTDGWRSYGASPGLYHIVKKGSNTRGPPGAPVFDANSMLQCNSHSRPCTEFPPRTVIQSARRPRPNER